MERETKRILRKARERITGDIFRIADQKKAPGIRRRLLTPIATPATTL